MNKVSAFILILIAVLLLGCCAKYSNAEMTDEGIEIVDIRPIITPTPTPPPPPPPTPTPKVIQYRHDADEVYALARWFYGSCYQTGDLDGKRKGAWHLWNRVIDDSGVFPDTILEVITQKGEYDFYDKHDDATPENLAIATEMLNRFEMERNGLQGGRTLPVGYVYQTVNESHTGYYYSKTVGGEPY